MSGRFPKRINAQLRRAMAAVAAGTPVALAVTATDLGYGNGLCHANVARHVAAHGGEAVHGWIVRDAGRIFDFEFHSVWRAPDGTLADITPRAEPLVLFLPDPRRRYDALGRVSYANRVFNKALNGWAFVGPDGPQAAETFFIPHAFGG